MHDRLYRAMADKGLDPNRISAVNGLLVNTAINISETGDSIPGVHVEVADSDAFFQWLLKTASEGIEPIRPKVVHARLDRREAFLKGLMQDA